MFWSKTVTDLSVSSFEKLLTFVTPSLDLIVCVLTLLGNNTLTKTGYTQTESTTFDAGHVPFNSLDHSQYKYFRKYFRASNCARIVALFLASQLRHTSSHASLRTTRVQADSGTSNRCTYNQTNPKHMEAVSDGTRHTFPYISIGNSFQLVLRRTPNVTSH